MTSSGMVLGLFCFGYGLGRLQSGLPMGRASHGPDCPSAVQVVASIPACYMGYNLLFIPGRYNGHIKASIND